MAELENKIFMQRFVEELMNKHNLDVLDEMVAEDFLELDPFPGQGPGREGLRYAVGVLLTAFPDTHWAVEEQIAEGENVVTRFTMTGTHQGSFMGIPPTGKSIKVAGVVFDVVRDNQFVESRIMIDNLTLLQQLSVVPSN